VARLEEQYQTSRLTRDQLASRLAQIEGEQSMLSEREQKLVARVEKQSEELLERAAEREQLLVSLSDAEARASSLREDLVRERARSADSELLAQRAKQALATLDAEIAKLRARVAELELRAATMSEPRLPPAARLERQLHPAAL
jgi:chromosome segregation ATPase